jgi:hypothetical protein
MGKPVLFTLQRTGHYDFAFTMMKLDLTIRPAFYKYGV